MQQSTRPILVLWTVVFLSGCSSSHRQWEITVENKSDVPCSFFITMGDGHSKAEVEDVAKGKVVSLIVGDAKTTVQSVRVVRGKDEKTLNPNIDIPAGKRYAIVVNADGKVETAIADR
jgi:hypothetical protein